MDEGRVTGGSSRDGEGGGKRKGIQGGRAKTKGHLKPYESLLLNEASMLGLGYI